MPAVYEKLGVCFEYPENWRLDEEEARPERKMISVHSPAGAFWCLSVHPAEEPPAELTATALAAMRQEYESLDAEEVSETVAGHEMVGYDMNFYCLDLISTAQVRAWQSWQGTYVVLSQAEDQEFDRLADVFQAITISLLSGGRDSRRAD